MAGSDYICCDKCDAKLLYVAGEDFEAEARARIGSAFCNDCCQVVSDEHITYRQAKEAIGKFDAEYVGQDQGKLWAWAIRQHGRVSR